MNLHFIAINNVFELREEFTIPELPEGREVVFSITTTWGDKHYVGLNGIEIFSSTGEPVTVEKVRDNRT